MKTTESHSLNVQSGRSFFLCEAAISGSPAHSRKQRNRDFRHGLLACLFASSLGVTTQAALAQVLGVSAHHDVVGVQTDLDGRTWLTLSVTLTNGGDADLSDVRLLTSPGLSPAPGNESHALAVGTLAMDTSVTMEWTFESIFAPSDGGPLPGPVLFLGEATDAFGDFVAFPVNSTTGEE